MDIIPSCRHALGCGKPTIPWLFVQRETAGIHIIFDIWYDVYIIYIFFESLIFLYQIINFMSYYPILRKIPGRILPGTTSKRLCSIILRLLKQRPAAVERRLRNTGTGIQFWWKPRELQEALQESMFFSYLLFVVLVGGWATPLKNIKVNWDHYSPYMGKKHVPNHQPVLFVVMFFSPSN